MSTASPMLKSDKEIGESIHSLFNRVLLLPVAIPFLFMKEEDSQFFMKSA